MTEYLIKYCELIFRYAPVFKYPLLIAKLANDACTLNDICSSSLQKHWDFIHGFPSLMCINNYTFTSKLVDNLCLRIKMNIHVYDYKDHHILNTQLYIHIHIFQRLCASVPSFKSQRRRCANYPAVSRRRCCQRKESAAVAGDLIARDEAFEPGRGAEPRICSI